MGFVGSAACAGAGWAGSWDRVEFAGEIVAEGEFLLSGGGGLLVEIGWDVVLSGTGDGGAAADARRE